MLSTAKTAKAAETKIDMTAIEAKLRPLETEELWDIFRESFERGAEFLAKAAMCVKLLEEREVDLRGLPHLGEFRKIAHGQLLPEFYWQFSSAPGRSVLEKLPLPDQKKLAANPMFPVIEFTQDGVTTRMEDLTRASAAKVKQVTGPDGLLTPEEQKALLMSQGRRPAPPSPAVETPDEPLSRSVTVRLTESEHAALTVNAGWARVSPSALARRGLVKSGVLRAERP